MQGAGSVGGLLSVSELQADDSWQTSYTISDANGNVMKLVDGQTLAVVAEYEYGPFGELIRMTGPRAKANPFRFSTKYQDEESELLYYGYRYYDAGIGRWLNRDPLAELKSINPGISLEDTSQVALKEYSFVQNNPIFKYDVLGLEEKCDRCGPEMGSCFHQTMMDVERKFNSLGVLGKLDACSGLDWPGNGWDMTFPDSPIQCATEICKNTVMLYGKCHNFWTADYAQWGQMNRLCGTPLQDALIGAWLWKNLSGKGEEYDATLADFVRAGWNGSGWDKVPENNKYKDCKACKGKGSKDPKYSQPFDTKWPYPSPGGH